MTERRTQQRFPMELNVDLQLAGDETASPCRGQTSNVSSNGFYLVGAPDALQEGSRVQLVLWLPTGGNGRHAGLRGLGRVVRIDHQAGEQVGVAVKFDRVELASTEVDSIT